MQHKSLHGSAKVPSHKPTLIELTGVLDNRVAEATCDVHVTHWQFVKAAATGSEIQLSVWRLHLDQETRGERFSGCKGLKGWRLTEWEPLKQVITVTPLSHRVLPFICCCGRKTETTQDAGRV